MKNFLSKIQKKFKKRKLSRGVTALEFALLATPFLFLIFSIIEIMFVFFAQTTLEASVAEEARKIRTGQAQGVLSREQFKQGVCDRMNGLANCNTRLFVMVQNFGSAAPANITNPWDANANLTIGSATAEPYENSAPNDLVLVRAYYIWPLFTPGLSNALSDYSNGSFGSTNRVLVASSAFRNEPF